VHTAVSVLRVIDGVNISVIGSYYYLVIGNFVIMLLAKRACFVEYFCDLFLWKHALLAMASSDFSEVCTVFSLFVAIIIHLHRNQTKMSFRSDVCSYTTRVLIGYLNSIKLHCSLPRYEFGPMTLANGKTFVIIIVNTSCCTLVAFGC